MNIIDMRCRPAFLHNFFGKTPGTPEYDVVRWLNRRVGTKGDDQHFTRSSTPEGFLAEVREAGLTRAVVVGRTTPSQQLPNDTIHQIVSADPVFVGIGSVDPIVQGTEAAVAEADRAIRTLGLRGIDVEPGFGSPPRHPDDPVYFPIYDLCQDLNVPVFIMSGPTTPDPRFNDPSGLAIVAQAFPRLKIAAYHGYWPNNEAAIGLAFRYENIHLIPDMYVFQAGSALMVQAANSFMSDQLLFGSSYPFRPIRQSIDDMQRLGFSDRVLDRVMSGNAARLLAF